MMYPFYSPEFTPFHWLMMLLFWGAAIIMVVAAGRWLMRQPEDAHHRTSSALEILKISWSNSTGRMNGQW